MVLINVFVVTTFITWLTFECFYMLVIILQLWGQTLWTVWGLQRRPSGWLPDPNWWTGPKPQWLRPQLEHRPRVRHYTRHMLLQLKDVSLLIHIIDDSPLILPSGVTSQRLAHPQGVQMLSRSCMKGLLTVVSYWTAMAHLLLAIQKSTPMWVKLNKLIWKTLVHNFSHITYLQILTLCVGFLPRLSLWRLWAGWCSFCFVWSNRVIRQWMSGPWSHNWTLEKQHLLSYVWKIHIP